MPTFTQSFELVLAETVMAFEDRFEMQLPADYRRFLQTTNGGVPDPNCFTVPGEGDALLDFLYGVDTERTKGDLEFEQQQVALWNPLPSGHIAIGHDPGGNAILLATDGKDAGRVSYWDRVGSWVQDDGHNTFPISTNFTEFIESLQELATGNQ